MRVSTHTSRFRAYALTLHHSPMLELKRLRDHPLIAQLERAAALDPTLASIRAQMTRAEELDRISREVFGVVAEDIGFDDDVDPSDVEWERFAARYDLAYAPDWDQVEGFRSLGWDVTDDNGRPLLVLNHFNWQLLAAIHGEFGAKLPGETPISAETWGSSIEAEARRFHAKGSSRN